MFENILNWRLLSGSHKFPGPDGGTCVNEAAIVAAGFEYRAVRSAEDCPPCFSRVIADYAIRLNDAMPDGLRQELLTPFVTRLAGTADTPEKEIERARYIAIQTIKRLLPIGLRPIGLGEHAYRCEQLDGLNATDAGEAANAAKDAAVDARYAAEAGANDRATIAAAIIVRATSLAADGAAKGGANATKYAAAVANAIVLARYDAAANADGFAAARRQIFAIATAILADAIELGNHAEPIETTLVVSRMNAISSTTRQSAPT
jgi:hypothetical protein